MAFYNLDDMFDFLEKDFSNTLQQEESNVKNVVVQEYIQQIDKNIYDAYDPRRYIRLEGYGGLTDPSNFDVEPEGTGIAITSTREGVDRSGEFAPVMEMLEGNRKQLYEDTQGYGFEEPRHAVQPTIDVLSNSDNLGKAFKVDLQERGYQVE